MEIREIGAVIGPKPVLAAGAGLLAAHALPSLAAVPGGRVVFPTLRRVDAPGVVALTFDDGPEPEALDGFLQALGHLEAGATFFLVGEQVRRAGSAPRAILEAGHEVACHGDRHRNHLRMGPKATVEDLRRARDTIEAATEQPVGCFRPPYGVFNAASWTFAATMGWRKVLWAAWGRDWEPAQTPETICDRVLRRIRGGDVVLLHDAERYSSPGSWRRTLGALRPLVEGLRERGLEPVPVGALLAAQEPAPAR
ncbi:MAG TPA: polysaccharide deacetylase family protein [Actinomycetota bacterium]|jgi:peptidoglycan/xylan/chitin deacetylase (PgdA/CDA1 family)